MPRKKPSGEVAKNRYQPLGLLLILLGGVLAVGTVVAVPAKFSVKRNLQRHTKRRARAGNRVLRGRSFGVHYEHRYGAILRFGAGHVHRAELR